MKSLLNIILVISLLSSCNTEKKIAKICATCPVVVKEKIVVKDSIVNKEIIKYDTIYKSIQGPTITIESPCSKFCDQNGNLKSFYKKVTNNGITGTISTNTVTNQIDFDCKEDSLMIINKNKEIQIEIYKNKITELEKQKPAVEVNILTAWQKIMIRSSYVFWIILIIFGGYKAIRFYTKLTKL